MIEKVNSMLALVEEIAEIVYQKQVRYGAPTEKVLLTPAEAACSLGFTERAFRQAEWSKEIPVVKVGIQNRYRSKDLETFAENHVMRRLD